MPPSCRRSMHGRNRRRRAAKARRRRGARASTSRSGPARMPATLKSRPVVFELMDEEFTLTELQRTVEAIAGRHLHKQNFRRLVESTALVENTGKMSTETGGGPRA